MRTIIVRPNRSLHRPELALLGVGFMLALLLGGVLTWLFGFWPILAFVLLNLAGLVVAIWSVERTGSYVEEIRIGDDWVSVSCGVQRPGSGFRVHRGWARLVEDQSGPWKRYRLWIGASGRYCEVGCCLGEEEKRELGERLRRYLVPRPARAAETSDSGPFPDGSLPKMHAGDCRI